MEDVQRKNARLFRGGLLLTYVSGTDAVEDWPGWTGDTTAVASLT
jgi:hypothetical protein